MVSEAVNNHFFLLSRKTHELIAGVCGAESPIVGTAQMYTTVPCGASPQTAVAVDSVV
jgi:hypothetical protein